jgi:hypothetical protein
MTSQTPLSPDTHLSVPDHVLSRKAAGETVLLSLADEQYYSLDGVGTFVWELVEAGTTFDETVRAVTADFDIDVTTVETDLQVLINELRRSNLITAT